MGDEQTNRREDGLAESFRQSGRPAGAYAADEASRYVRRGFRRAGEVLAGDPAMAVFPEGYSNIDPGFTPKCGPDDFLPFRD